MPTVYVEGMLLLVDLGNTLVDRAHAFNTWAIDFVRSLGRPCSDAEWLITADRDGGEPRKSLAHTISARFEIALSTGVFVNELLYDHVRLMSVAPSIIKY